jgi:tetratricopeptide (TPR) repeat protein
MEPLSPALSDVLAALERKDFREAQALAITALRSGAEHPLLLNLRAMWFQSRGELESAIADLSRARQLAPGDVSTLNALGLALQQGERYREAREAFEAALAADPNFAPAQFNRAVVAESLGRLDIARTSYEAALSCGQPFPELLVRLANLASRRGDWPSSRDYADRALAADASNIGAGLLRAIADVQDRCFVDAESRLDALLGRADLTPEQRYLLRGAKGDLFHRQRRYDKAFDEYRDGNDDYHRSVAPQFPRRQTASAIVDWMTDYFRGKRPAAHAASAIKRGRQPDEPLSHIFLIGFPRSGTTLVEQALAGHPEVVSLQEHEAFVESGRAFMADAGGLDRLHATASDELDPYRAAYWRRVRAMEVEPAGKVFIDKLPFHALMLPLIARLFPESRVLFAVRDPRDVILSCLRCRFRMNPYTYELLRPEDAATFYAGYMQLSEMLRSILPLSFLTIRHEDVVADFDTRMLEIANFCGIDGSVPAVQGFADRARAGLVTTPSGSQLVAGLSTAGIGQWRNYAEFLQPAMPALSPWLARFGYDSD